MVQKPELVTGVSICRLVYKREKLLAPGRDHICVVELERRFSREGARFLDHSPLSL